MKLAQKRSTQQQTSKNLNQKDIQSLFNGKILAICIPQFCDPELAKEIAKKMLNSNKITYYNAIGAGDVGKFGLAYCETTGNFLVYQQYYAESIFNIQQLRNMSHPNLFPMDKLRLTTEEMWPKGATLENLDNKTMNVALARILNQGARIEPHQDLLEIDAPNNPRAKEIKTQLAANIYLSIDEGGELELWDRHLSSKEYDELRFEDNYYVERRFLGAPDLVIQPQVGDLILFRSNYLHAVSPVKKGVRVTTSCFIGYRGDDKPLSYWS